MKYNTCTLTLETQTFLTLLQGLMTYSEGLNIRFASHTADYAVVQAALPKTGSSFHHIAPYVGGLSHFLVQIY